MSLPPLQLANIPHVRIVGEVVIHPSAAIAPGAILQAAPNSQIIIAAGVCVGMGVILNAYGGKIEVETGASLGAGVLVVGCSKIGANTCIGGGTTIYNADLDSLQVIPAGSVIGDPSRRVELISERETDLSTAKSPRANKEEFPPSQSEETTELPQNSVLEDPWTSETEAMMEIATDLPTDLPTKTTIEPIDKSVPKQPGTPVFGKVYVNQLLLTLFPERSKDEG